LRIIDLTQTIKEGMPVYPGTEPPMLSAASTLLTDGFRETGISLYSHTGTHMDAPSHIFEDGETLDSIPPERFFGKALTVDCRNSGETIGMEAIDREKADKAEYILFFTGHDRFWNDGRYFEGYPVCGRSVIDYIVGSGKKGIGFDTISADPVGSLENHRILLKNGVLIVENLTRLWETGNGLVGFWALPMKYESADGAPVRAVAMMD
jgi:kynurenine formamidase